MDSICKTNNAPRENRSFPQGVPGAEEVCVCLFLSETEGHRALLVLDLAEFVPVAVNQYRHWSGGSRRRQ